MKASVEFRTTTNTRVYRRLARKLFHNCSYCPPNKIENEHGSHSKHGKKKLFKKKRKLEDKS